MKMKMQILVAGVVACGVGIAIGGCGQQTRRAPELSETTAPAPVAERPNWVVRAADGTWQAVQAPVKMMTAKPKAAKKKEEPETYEPADAVIIQRPAGEEGAESAGAEPATQAGTRP